MTSGSTASAASPTSESAPELTALRSFLYEDCRLYIGEERDSELLRALEWAARSSGVPAAEIVEAVLRAGAGSESLTDLVERLQAEEPDEEETRRLQVFRDRFAVPLQRRAAERRQGTLRLWSVGMESGRHDPFRIAAILQESGNPVPFDLLASEPAGFDRAVPLRKAPIADLSEEAFTRCEGGYRWSEAVEVRVRPIDFEPTAAPVGGPEGEFDAIFARHVLCRLPAEVRPRLVRLFQERLQPGGLLFLGRGESLESGETPLRLILYPGGVVYRRPLKS